MTTGIHLNIKVAVDSIHFDLLQALKFKTELTYEEIFSIALTHYSRLRLPEEQVTEILKNHGKI